MLALFSDKQGGQNSSKVISNLLSNPVEREPLSLELWENITGVALSHMPVLKQSLWPGGCDTSTGETYTFVHS